MAGLIGLSLDSRATKDDFSKNLFWATFYHQHLGMQYGGLSTNDSEKIEIRTCKGLFRSHFNKDLNGLGGGKEGIGYCGPCREPFRVDSRAGRMSLCFSGNIINHWELINSFERSGDIFERGDDIEIIAKLIAKGKTILNGISLINAKVRGAFSLLILTQPGIYAVCDPSGHWPMVIGKKEKAIVIASESSGLENLGFKVIRDMKPGEVVFLENGNWKIKSVINSNQNQICSFLWVYTAFPNAVIKGVPASLVRKRLGSLLAQRDIEKGFIPDIVAPVPDSGRFHAIGYYQEFCRQIMAGNINKIPIYDEILLKYGFAKRSYPLQNKEKRREEAYIKILKTGESCENLTENFDRSLNSGFNSSSCKDLKLVLCDDSVVRGNQIKQNLVPKLRAIGMDKIYLRVSNPKLFAHCPWGKTTKKGETLAAKFSGIEEMIRELGVNGLEYNRVDDLVKAIGLPKESLCMDCSLNSE